jgi:hypothetical protein
MCALHAHLGAGVSVRLGSTRRGVRAECEVICLFRRPMRMSSRRRDAKWPLPAFSQWERGRRRGRVDVEFFHNVSQQRAVGYGTASHAVQSSKRRETYEATGAVAAQWECC